MSADDIEIDEPESTALDIEPLLPWQESALSSILSRRDNWHHAALLHGAAGTGLRRFSLHLAQALLCRTPTASGVACGACDACHLFVAGNHPDFRLVERQWVKPKSGDGEARLREAIIIDQVRRLIDDFLYLTSHRQGAKVVVIHLAEEMNPAAANALLKSLEEPPEATYFILVSHQLRLLKPTIISRCRRIAAPQPGTDDAIRWLEGQGATNPSAVLAQAGGAPLKALSMLEPEYQSERVRFLERLSDPRRMSIATMGAELEAGPRALRRARLELWIDWLATWSYDLARMATLRSTVTGQEAPLPRYHVDFARPLGALAATVAAVPVLRYHRTLLQDRALLSHPLNPRLVVENALHGYRQAIAASA